MASWRAQQQSPWGRLRYRQAEANLLRHLGPDPLRILDITGSNGADAIPLARHGHHVTVLDYSGEMLAGARAAAAEAGVAHLVETVEAEVTAMPVASGSFDVVLCHNLVQYFSDPWAHPARRALGVAPWRRTLRGLDQSGDGAAAPRAARARPGRGTGRARRARMTTKTFGHDVTLSTPDEMIDHLSRSGAKPLDWYGIRAICDYLPDNEIKHDPVFYDALERLEFAITDHPPIAATPGSTRSSRRAPNVRRHRTSTVMMRRV